MAYARAKEHTSGLLLHGCPRNARRLAVHSLWRLCQPDPIRPSAFTAPMAPPASGPAAIFRSHHWRCVHRAAAWDPQRVRPPGNQGRRNWYCNGTATQTRQHPHSYTRCYKGHTSINWALISGEAWRRMRTLCVALPSNSWSLTEDWRKEGGLVYTKFQSASHGPCWQEEHPVQTCQHRLHWYRANKTQF